MPVEKPAPVVDIGALVQRHRITGIGSGEYIHIQSLAHRIVQRFAPPFRPGCGDELLYRLPPFGLGIIHDIDDAEAVENDRHVRFKGLLPPVSGRSLNTVRCESQTRRDIDTPRLSGRDFRDGLVDARRYIAQVLPTGDIEPVGDVMRIFGEGSEKPGRFLVTVVNDVAVQVTDDIFHIHPPAPDVHLRGTSVRQGLDYLIIHPCISERFGIGSITAHPDVERLVLYLVEILALGPGARAEGACGDGDRQRFQNMSHHISLFGAMPSHWFSITFSTFTRQATGVLGGSCCTVWSP